MAFNGLSSHGLSCTWGTTSFSVTSLQYNASASGEIDVTFIGSGTAADPNWSSRKLVYKSTEYSVVDPGEVQMEFIANTAAMALPGFVGHKRQLTFQDAPATPGGTSGFTVTWKGILTQFSAQMQAGEFIRGNCTFKLTEF